MELIFYYFDIIIRLREANESPKVSREIQESILLFGTKFCFQNINGKHKNSNL